MWKDDLNVHVFQNRNWFNLKSDQWSFFELWLSQDLSIRRLLSEGKYGGTGLISEKKGSFVCET